MFPNNHLRLKDVERSALAGTACALPESTLERGSIWAFRPDGSDSIRMLGLTTQLSKFGLNSKRVFVPLAFMVLIFVQSSFPAPAIPRLVKDGGLIRTDDILHSIEYGILGFLWGWALRCPALLSAVGGFAWAVGSLYGVSDEIHQYFVPRRSAQLRECVVDTFGSACGVMAWTLWMRWRRARQTSEV